MFLHIIYFNTNYNFIKHRCLLSYCAVVMCYFNTVQPCQIIYNVLTENVLSKLIKCVHFVISPSFSSCGKVRKTSWGFTTCPGWEIRSYVMIQKWRENRAGHRWVNWRAVSAIKWVSAWSERCPDSCVLHVMYKCPPSAQTVMYCLAKVSIMSNTFKSLWTGICDRLFFRILTHFQGKWNFLREK